MQSLKPQPDLDDALSIVEDESIAPARRARHAAWKILVVDDDPEVHAATRFVLNRRELLGRPLDLIETMNSRDAQDALLLHSDIAVVLLDVVMEEHDSGLKFAKWIREAGYHNARIILRTGQPGYAPELDVIRDYDINDYRSKGELTQTRLITSITAALRSFQQIETIERSRRGLEMIIASCSKLFQERELAGFSRGVLIQIASLCAVEGDGLIAARPPGGKTPARIVSGVGGVAHLIGCDLDALDDAHTLKAPAALGMDSGRSTTHGPIVLAIGAPQDRRFVAAIDHDGPLDDMDTALLRVFSANIAVGFENVGLIERLDRLAYWDEAAGLPNRNQLLKDLAAPGHTGFTLALLRVANYADTLVAFGQDMATGLLAEIAATLELPPDGRTTYRYGEDVLATILPAGGPQEQRLETLSQRVFRVGPQAIRARFAVGVCAIEPGIDPETACNRAYAAMSLGVQSGQVEPVAYRAPMTEDARVRMQTAADLRDALDRGELDIVFQPLVDMASGDCKGLEALCRWTRAGKPVSPGVFIPLAEQTGLSLEIFALGVKRAAEWLAGRPKAETPVYVSVNLSPRDLDRPDLVPFTMSLLGRVGMAPSLLQIEITEQSLISDFKRSEANLRALKSLGCRIAIDDFGTGYSSLSYIGRLPVDVLKLDRQFVVGLSEDPAARAIAGLTLELSRRLGLEMLAEGVETEEQQAALETLGYCYAQGYRFARPMPPAALDAWLADRA
jgi:EAL domain-containing protein (putative c-di-GMP-specific phosphodiesterase class I)/PleD family two-component response regulator